VWCDLNAESNLLHKLIPDSVEIQGSDTPEKKASAVIDFTNKNIRCIVSKSSIFGFGVNWQQCHNVIFVGLSDSYEQYYQAVRRCWRFGQDQIVNVYIIISKNEGAVLENINRKESDSRQMISEMVKYTKEITRKELTRTSRLSAPYNPKKEMVLPHWEEFGYECA
jgi:SNF2 family DNA or RNA helicase